MHFNPGWNDSSVNLLHVRAVDANSTLHYVWSSLGVPAVLLLYTENKHSTLHINWTQLLSPEPAGAIWVEPPSSVLHASAVVFTKVGDWVVAHPCTPAFGCPLPPLPLGGGWWAGSSAGCRGGEGGSGPQLTQPHLSHGPSCSSMMGPMHRARPTRSSIHPTTWPPSLGTA